MKVLSMADLDLRGKRVLIREDLNVPVAGGKVTSDARIRASLPTIRMAMEKGAKVFLMSHLGRPEEGVFAEESSLAPVAARLGELLGRPVPLVRDWLGGVDCAPGSVVLCENVRFNVGEEKDDETLSRRMAARSASAAASPTRSSTIPTRASRATRPASCGARRRARRAIRCSACTPRCACRSGSTTCSRTSSW